jgi:RNA polymerase sigma-70 factor (ECF subfamily)
MDRREDPSRSIELVLAAELAAGNAEAFQELVRREGPELIRYGTAILFSREAARDAAQETFNRLWQERARLTPDTHLVRLLRTIIRSLARDRLGHRKTEPGPAPSLDPLHLLQARPLFPEADDEGGDIQTAMQRALDSLSRRQREILILRWNHRLTYEQIGAKLGVSPGTASAHMQRAIAHLRILLPMPLGDLHPHDRRDRYVRPPRSSSE